MLFIPDTAPCPQIPLGTLDTAWMPEVSRLNLVVIARDRHIRTKPGELELLRAFGLRVLWIGGKKDLTTWDSLVRIVRRWPDIEALIAARSHGPWFYSVNDADLREIVTY